MIPRWVRRMRRVIRKSNEFRISVHVTKNRRERRRKSAKETIGYSSGEREYIGDSTRLNLANMQCMSRLMPTCSYWFKQLQGMKFQRLTEILSR